MMTCTRNPGHFLAILCEVIMRLSTIFSQLETSELNQLNCIDQATGKIRPDKYRSIVDIMNQGMVDLHTRFKLRVGTVTIPLDADRAQYNMAEFDPHVKGRFLQLHDVRDEHDRVLPTGGYGGHFINFVSDMLMVVPEHLRKTYPIRQVIVQYRSLPTRIGCDDDIDPEFDTVELPQPYVLALCLYVASRLQAPVGLQDSTYRVNTYLQRYEAECSRLKDENVELDYQQDLGHLRRGGWA